MSNKDKIMRDFHEDLKERLERAGDSISDNELLDIHIKLMEEYRVLRDLVPKDHKILIGNILVLIKRLRGIA